MILDSPLNTDLTNMAPKANPITLFVSVTQNLHGVSFPSDPISAFLKILDASRKGFDIV